MQRVWLIVVLLCCSLCGSLAAKCALTGVNLAGGEYGGGTIPGTYTKDYIYPPQKSIDYFAAKGMNVFRIPLQQQRFQHYPGGPLVTAELARLDAAVNYITNTLGKYALLDPHNYGQYFGGKIGESACPQSVFGDWWFKFAGYYKDNAKVIFNLINEPNGQSAAIWWTAAQVAVTAIRNAGATQLILVPGVSWTGAHSWINSGNGANMINVKDPLNNMAFEVHQYVDAYSSGTSATCVSATVGSQRLAVFTNWAKANKVKGFLGEFGGGRSDVCLQAIDNMIVHMNNNTDVWLGWTYWCGGPWVPDNYFSNLQANATGADRPQWASIGPHVNTAPVTLPRPVAIAAKAVSQITTSLGPYLFDDGLIGFSASASGATYSLANTSVVKRGARSISFTPAARGSLRFLTTDTPTTVGKYLTLDFWFNPGPNVGSANLITFNLLNSSNIPIKPAMILGNILEGTVEANTWSKVHVTLLNYNKTAIINGFQLSSIADTALPTVHFDDLVYVTYANSIPPPALPTPTVITTTVIYDDALYGFTVGNSFNAFQSIVNKSIVHNGTYSIKIEPTNYGALFLQCQTAGCINLNGNLTLEFWFNPGPTGTASRYNFNLVTGTSKSNPTKSLGSFLSHVPDKNEWVKAYVPLSQIYTIGVYDGFHISGNVGTQVEPVFFDDIKLVFYPADTIDTETTTTGTPSDTTDTTSQSTTAAGSTTASVASSSTGSKTATTSTGSKTTTTTGSKTSTSASASTSPASSTSSTNADSSTSSAPSATSSTSASPSTENPSSTNPSTSQPTSGASVLQVSYVVLLIVALVCTY